MHLPAPLKEGYQPDLQTLNNAIPWILPEQAARAKIDLLAEKGILPGRDKPLTEEEANAIDQKVAELKDKGLRLQGQIQIMKQSLDEMISASGRPEPRVKVDLKNNPALRKAIQDIFGYKTDEITYTMYKEVLEAKRMLEQQEVDGVLGKTDANL